MAADAAEALGVSTDWLLGLTNRPETPGDLVAAAMSLSPAERTSADEQLLEWHREAAGYKVRHVPATLTGFQRGTHTNWQLVQDDGSGAPTLTDLGASFPVNSGYWPSSD